jgi:hypothetical protein
VVRSLVFCGVDGMVVVHVPGFGMRRRRSAVDGRRGMDVVEADGGCSCAWWSRWSRTRRSCWRWSRMSWMYPAVRAPRCDRCGRPWHARHGRRRRGLWIVCGLGETISTEVPRVFVFFDFRPHSPNDTM